RERPPGAFESSVNDPSDQPNTPLQRSHISLTTAPSTVGPLKGKQQVDPPSETDPDNNDEEDEEYARRLQIGTSRDWSSQDIKNVASNPDIPAPSASRNAPWNPDMSSILNYALYDPDSRAGNAIAQFKQDTKNISKPNALTGTANYVTWRAAVKAKIIDAQCWVIIEREQYEDPLGSPEWAPFWNVKNSATVRSHIIPKDDDRMAYSLWDVLENEYSIPKTQQRREVVIEFMALAGTQVDDVHLFFEKFRTSIVKLKTVDVQLPDSVIFDVFYSALPNLWRNHVQCKVEESQTSKSTAVTLEVNLLIKEIRAHLNPPKSKDKKPFRTAESI
ncbi:hypothetical protein GX50_08816, partial [[Emmonsia] crescens]